ncbi:MAG: MBL fold metallo-hydrolase [Desulfobulbaceae bacterium]|nr:MBL fold metallo-hydrolase [Desulfobulbaceae bacterium]
MKSKTKIENITTGNMVYGNFLLILCLFLFLSLFFRQQASAIEQQENPGKLIYVYGDRDLETPDLQRAFGLVTLVEFDGKRILFDTGGDGSILQNNMNKMGIDPKSLDLVVISHHHWEMVGGVDFLLQQNPNLRVISTNKVVSLLKGYHKEWHVENIGQSLKITPNIFVMKLKSGFMQGGPMGIEELHLILKTKKGLVILEGCGHPGVLKVVTESMTQLHEKKMYLLSGGTQLLDRGHKVMLSSCDSEFHKYVLGKMPMKSLQCGQQFSIPQPHPYSDNEVAHIANQLIATGMQYIVPTLCTGERPEKIFANYFHEKYISQKLGLSIPLPLPATL